MKKKRKTRRGGYRALLNKTTGQKNIKKNSCNGIHALYRKVKKDTWSKGRWLLLLGGNDPHPLLARFKSAQLFFHFFFYQEVVQMFLTPTIACSSPFLFNRHRHIDGRRKKKGDPRQEISYKNCHYRNLYGIPNLTFLRNTQRANIRILSIDMHKDIFIFFFLYLTRGL